MNYKEEKNKLIQGIVEYALNTNDVYLKIDVYRFLDEIAAELPDYTGVLDKFKEMKEAEDGTKVAVKTKLRRLANG